MGYYSELIRYDNVKTNLPVEEFYDRWEKAKQSLIGTDYEGDLDIYEWEKNSNGFSLKLEEWYAKHYGDWKLAEFISEVIAPSTSCILEFVGEDGFFWGYYITSGKVDEIQYVKMVNGQIID